MATPKDLPRDIGGFIRDLRRNARISLRQLAEQAGVSNPYLSQIERGLRKPSAEVLQQLASALRVSTPVMYLRAGLLDDSNGQGVLAAIAADAELTMAQKQSLSQIYETFRRENAHVKAETGTETADPAGTAGPGTGPGPAAGNPATAGMAYPESGNPVEVSPAEAVLESVAVTETGAAPAPTPAPDKPAPATAAPGGSPRSKSPTARRKTAEQAPQHDTPTVEEDN